ncbi:hypothetical protein [Primorskyibacter sp. S187A]
MKTFVIVASLIVAGLAVVAQTSPQPAGTASDPNLSGERAAQ